MPDGEVAPITVDTLFNNFETLTSFRNNFITNLVKLGEDEPTRLFLWVAYTKDKRYIPNIEKDGTINKFGKVLYEANTNNLSALYFVPRDKNLLTHKVTIPVGCKPICAYRTGISKLPNGSFIRYVQYYLLGFHKTIDGRSYQVMRIIKPSGEFRDTTNFKLRWHSESDEVGVPAMLYPKHT